MGCLGNACPKPPHRPWRAAISLNAQETKIVTTMIHRQRARRAVIVLLGIALASSPAGVEADSFVRGDANADGVVDLSDAFRMVLQLFAAQPIPCADATDANDDGALNITDPIFTLNYLFRGGAAIPAPLQRCARDPTEDPLRCLSYPRPGCVTPPPVAAFTATPQAGKAPLHVTLDATGSTDPEGGGLTHEWDFGDGKTGGGPVVAHLFELVGEYAVRLTVTDAAGRRDEAEASIAALPPEPPHASFSATPLFGSAPLEVTFDAATSIDPDGMVVSYSWSLGEGSAAAGPLVTHTYSAPGSYTVSLQVRDVDDLVDTFTQTIVVRPPALPAPTLEPVASPTRLPTAVVSGATVPGALVSVGGGAAVATAVAGSDGAFSATVTLSRGKVNALAVIATAGEQASPPAWIAIVHDDQAPSVFIEYPADGQVTADAAVTVTGRVGDILDATGGVVVEVNGLAASVLPGTGLNGTFERRGVPLSPGANTIRATAWDAAGNSATREFTVQRVEPEPGEPRLSIVSGDAQSAGVGRWVPQPLVVTVVGGDGAPIAGKLVEFSVTRSNGFLAPSRPADLASLVRTLSVRTDSQGRARAAWLLGSDAGRGNHRVEVSTAGVPAPVVFCASADPSLPVAIAVGSGDNQLVETSAPAPRRLVAWVNDGQNGVPGVPVTFRVVRGSGRVDGASSIEVATDATGHAGVAFTLGAEPGNQVVEADFADNPYLPARFTVRGVARSSSATTAFSGVVLDNAMHPLRRVTVSLAIAGAAPLVATTSDNGQFRFGDIGAEGAATLHVDGATADRSGARPVSPGTYPALDFTATIIPRAENALPAAVVLVPIARESGVAYDGTRDVQLTMPGVEGFRITVAAGSMRLADGTRPSLASPVTLTVSQVPAGSVGQAIPDGITPALAWNLEPSGASFDPPARVEVPNMACLPPGTAATVYRDHPATGSFTPVATASVSEDGATIVTDAGSGAVGASLGFIGAGALGAFAVAFAYAFPYWIPDEGFVLPRIVRRRPCSDTIVGTGAFTQSVHAGTLGEK
jgi:PKD repeat protein